MATLEKSKLKKRRLSALMREQKVLSSRLSRVEKEIFKLGQNSGKVTSPATLDRMLDELASQSKGHALPADFSRADLYDDHD